MGRDKAWLEVRGQPLLPRALATVSRAGAKEVFISGRADGNYQGLDCPVLLDLKPGRGPLGGIERALAAMSSPLLLVLAVDLPNMTSRFLRKLISCYDERTGVVPERRGELEPLVAFYPQRCHALVRDALRQQRLAARDFAEVCRREGAVKSYPVAATDFIRFANCNSPGDLADTESPRKSRSKFAIRLGLSGKTS